MSRAVFPCGARVYVDGRDVAIVRAAFPQGSTSYAFPHYRVRYVAGAACDHDAIVQRSRVGVVAAKVSA